jgi:hypothetical protein
MPPAIPAGTFHSVNICLYANAPSKRHQIKSLMVQQNTQPEHLPANNIQMLAQQIDPLLFKGN